MAKGLEEKSSFSSGHQQATDVCIAQIQAEQRGYLKCHILFL